MDNDFNNFKDPYDRLEELEIITTGQGIALEEASDQLKSQAFMLEQLSGALLELAQALNSQHRILMDQARHIKRLENEK
jgi:uncharacterized coiled-coil protein SlyX